MTDPKDAHIAGLHQKCADLTRQLDRAWSQLTVARLRLDKLKEVAEPPAMLVTHPPDARQLSRPFRTYQIPEEDYRCLQRLRELLKDA